MSLTRFAPALLMTLVALIAPATPASAQYFGYGYPAYGYGGLGYGGYGYGGYGGLGYGGYGYGGYGYGGYGYPGYGFGATYGNPAFGYGFTLMPGYIGTGLAGVGYPGIGGRNPYFSFGLSPLAVENAIFERTVLGRTTPAYGSVRTTQSMPRPTTSGPVGMGTFGP